MTRALAIVVCALVAFAVLLLAAILSERVEPGPRAIASTSERTETTTWSNGPEITLPSGFDPRRVEEWTHPKPATKQKPRPIIYGDSVWDAIARCESGGDWADTRVGYEGGVHFLHSTWIAAGGRRYAEHAYQATREQQIEIAASWLAKTSWAQWPVCSRKVGVR